MSECDKFTVRRRRSPRVENLKDLTLPVENVMGRYDTHNEAIAARNLLESKDGGWDASATIFSTYHVTYPARE